MRLNLVNRLTAEYNRQAMQRMFTDLQNQLNNLSEGVLNAKTNAQTAAPTTGTYQVGDFVANSTPSEAGGAGNKYIVIGWMCSVTPNTFLQCRVLTGN